MFKGRNSEQDFRLAPVLLATFGIVVTLLVVYEVGLSWRLKVFGAWESIVSISLSALIAVTPTYFALRKQRQLHRYALSALRELREAKAVLAESERRFREMLENVELLAVTVNRDGLITFCNNHLLRLTGWNLEEVLAKDWFALFASEPQAVRREDYLRNIASGEFPKHIENKVKARDGALREISWNLTVLRDGAGLIIGTASIGDDVTDRRQAERHKQLEYSVTAVMAEGTTLRGTYSSILETLCRELHWDIGVLWMVDRSDKVIRCAEAWHPSPTPYQQFGAQRRQATFAMGEGLPGSVWAEGIAKWRADIDQDPSGERLWTASDERLRGWIGFPIVLSNQILGVVEIFSGHVQPPDREVLATLTAIGEKIGQFIDRRVLEERFRQAQKMEAIGTLSGGIAHDFNNILGAIIGYTELAKMEIGDDPRVIEHLGDVLKGAKRAAALVRQILAFSRQQEQERKPIQIRHVVAEALDLLRATIPTQIEFKTSLETEVPTVLADATQIHQIVMNLGTNAAHAMKDRLGRLTVTIENFHADEDFVEMHPELQPMGYVRLSISDNGVGMDSSTLGRIFEPFFTTKAPGEGTGLGLAVVQGIMQCHEGAVTVYSHPGEGTTFHLYFPAYGVAEEGPTGESAATPHGRGERILYVDDERILARMGKKILERLGYAVEISSSAAEALDAVRTSPAAYDLVITDQMMPTLTGLDLARQILEIRPDLPIILVTGYTANLTLERVKALGIQDLLMKPVSVAALGSAVHRVLTESNIGVPYETNTAC